MRFERSYSWGLNVPPWSPGAYVRLLARHDNPEDRNTVLSQHRPAARRQAIYLRRLPGLAKITQICGGASQTLHMVLARQLLKRPPMVVAVGSGRLPDASPACMAPAACLVGSK